MTRRSSSRFMKNSSELYQKAVDILRELNEKEGTADCAFADACADNIKARWWETDYKQSRAIPCISSILNEKISRQPHAKPLYGDHKNLHSGETRKKSITLWAQPEHV